MKMMKLITRSKLIKEAERLGLEAHEYALQLVREEPEIEIINDLK